MSNLLKIILFSICAALFNSAYAVDIAAKPVPKDIVEFTCNDFTQNALDCIPYSCQAPYMLDPTVATQWQIIEHKQNRCVISDTTNDIGLKDYHGKSVPVTRTCQYTAEGVEELTYLLEDIEAGFFKASMGSQDDGAFQCTFTANGEPLASKAYQQPEEE